MDRKKTRVIFLCTGNSARSQMGEAFLRHYASDHFEVYSAGFDAKGIHPLTKQVMDERGIDLSEHSSKHLDQYLGQKHFGITITVCAKAEETCPTYPSMGTRLFWPFPDPAAFEGTKEEKLEKFREVRDNIEAKILEWLRSRGLKT
ncbi:arsenate reductase ArsC [Candidatus Bathyarchaeota archaeon]|nr:arsenate reductase ArsC [Candidatus Bathyarchaeota archaeon]